MTDIKEAIFDNEARQKLLEGVEILAKAVTTTLGPMGQNVIIERIGQEHIITKDGVTVAKSINLLDPYKQMGCQIVREAAQKTNDDAGDGTTTATVLAHAIFSEGVKLLSAGYSARDVKKGIDAIVPLIVENLKAMAVNVDDKMIVDIGTISANGEKSIGELILSAINSVGKDGTITIESGKSVKTSLEIVDGARIDRGYLSPYFATDKGKMICELVDPVVIVSNLRFGSANEIIPLLEVIAKNQKQLLIIADEIEPEIMQLLVTNHTRGSLKCCVIKAPSFGENRLNTLLDLASLLGCNVLTSGDKVDTHVKAQTVYSTLGKCKKVIIDKSTTTFIGCIGNKDEVSKRIESIKASLNDFTLDVETRKMLNERVGRLSNGVALIRVGGASEIEMIERKYRVEDALHAVQAAIAEGVVPGGGVALMKAANKAYKKLKSVKGQELIGIRLVVEACNFPFKKIIDNAKTASSDVLSHKIMKSNNNIGYNALTGKCVNAIEAGIIDPVKVTRVALQNAASVAGTLLTANVCVIDTIERTADKML